MEILSYLGIQITGFGKAFLNTFIKGPEELASFAMRCCLTKPCAFTSTDSWLIVLMLLNLEYSWRSDMCLAFLSWLFSSPGSMSTYTRKNEHPGWKPPFMWQGQAIWDNLPFPGLNAVAESTSINRQFTGEEVSSATEVLTLPLDFADLRQWPSLCAS